MEINDKQKNREVELHNVKEEIKGEFFSKLTVIDYWDRYTPTNKKSFNIMDVAIKENIAKDKNIIINSKKMNALSLINNVINSANDQIIFLEEKQSRKLSPNEINDKLNYYFEKVLQDEAMNWMSISKNNKRKY